MIRLQSEIENCLQTIRNTNNKEQNFQGRLYAYFMKFEKEGYVVEMETNIKDIPNISHLDNYSKKEIDILIYKKDYSEKYAIELKWTYDPGFHYLDKLEEYKKDVVFVRQLVQFANFNETCSVIVMDTNPNHLTNPSENRINKEEEKLFEEGSICGECFGKRKILYGAYEYIIIPFKKSVKY